MAKNIEQVFTFKANSERHIHITARNYNDHLITLSTARVCIDTKKMREFATFLIETADKIDSDPDFNKKS